MNTIQTYINTVIQGDALKVLKHLPDNSIDCVITSPPYWQLRDYHWQGQWGLEPTYTEYLERLWLLMDEIYRVLKTSGTVWINLGDTYFGSGNGSGNPNSDFNQCKNKTGVAPKKPNTNKANQLKAKCQVLIPHRFAIDCIDRSWIIRNDIIWAKPNGMPEPVKDRFCKKHEFIFFMAKSPNYYFDLDKVRMPHQASSLERIKHKWNGNREKGTAYAKMNIKKMCHKNGKNPSDVSDFWKITTKSSKDKHYASYNSELIETPDRKSVV